MHFFVLSKIKDFFTFVHNCTGSSELETPTARKIRRFLLQVHVHLSFIKVVEYFLFSEILKMFYLLKVTFCMIKYQDSKFSKYRRSFERVVLKQISRLNFCDLIKSVGENHTLQEFRLW